MRLFGICKMLLIHLGKFQFSCFAWRVRIGPWNASANCCYCWSTAGGTPSNWSSQKTRWVCHGACPKLMQDRCLSYMFIIMPLKIAKHWRCHAEFSFLADLAGEAAAENDSKPEDKKTFSRLQRSVLARCGPLARGLARHKRGPDGQPIVNPEVHEVKHWGFVEHRVLYPMVPPINHD